MARHYVEAYDTNGRQIFGNLDGQGVIHCANPKRSAHWRRLISQPRERLSLGGRVACYRLINEAGKQVAAVWPFQTGRERF